MLSGRYRGPMPCHYPQGAATEWCERHQKDHEMIQQLRAQPASA